MRAQDFLPPERAKQWLAFYRRALAEGPYRTEYSLADGRTLELAFNPIEVDGVTSGISVFGKDITDQKRAEEAQREAERRYRSIFEGVLGGIFQTSLEGKPQTANPAFVEMLGYDSREDFFCSVHETGRDIWANPQERAHFLHLLEEQREVRGYRCQFKCKDGTPIWVSLNCRIALAADGVTRYCEGFIEDITERKRMELEMIHREKSSAQSNT